MLGPLWASFVGEGAEIGRVVVGRRIDLEALPPGAAEQLEAAARAASKIRDPSLAAALDVVRGEQELVVVSEYVDGETLASLLRFSAEKRMPIPVAVALRIGNDLLTSLRAARSAWTGAIAIKGPEHVALLSAVYGGLSPEHVFVAHYGDAVLSEVGVTGVAATLPKIGRHPAVLAYRAPEQLALAQADERTDIFSLGVILWEMLAARSLFGDASRSGGATSDAPAKPGEASSVAERLRDKPIPRLDELGRTGTPIPLEVAALVARCLERNPAQRYPTVEDAQQAVQALGEELIATPEQVSIFVDRLARKPIDERRAAIAAALRVTRGDNTPPTSRRKTLRPDEPDSAPRSDSTFRDSERPTLHHVVEPPPIGAAPPAPAAVAALSPAPAAAPNPAPSQAELRLPPPPAEFDGAGSEPWDSDSPRLSPLGTEVPVQFASTPAASAKGPRAVLLVLAIAALVGASVGALMMVRNRGGSPVTRHPARPDESQAEPAATASQTPTDTAQSSRPDTLPTAPAETALAAPSAPVRAAPRRSSAAGPTRAPSESSSSTRAKNAFRPSGI